MSKYDGLGRFLREQKSDVVPMTFADIERVTGAKLPNSKRYPAWWSNNAFNNVMTKIWLDAGFHTEQVDVEGKKLVFKRVAAKKPASGMAEEPREFKPTETDAEKKPRRHPAFGALKGLLWIEPGYDLTQPTWDDEMEEAFNKKWDELLK